MLLNLEDRWRALLLTLVAAMCFAVMSVLVKLAEHSLGSEQIIFFRYFISTIIVLPYFMLGKKHTFKTKHPYLHLFRGISGICAMTCLFVALTLLPVANAVLLSLTYPLFIPILMLIIFHHRLSKLVLLGILIGFLGVFLILDPTKSGLLHYSSLIGLGAGFFLAIVMMFVYQLNKTESSELILFYFFLIITLVSGVLMFFNWHPLSFRLDEILVGAAMVGFLYQQTLTYALRYASPTLVAPMMYSTVVFAALLGWLIWGEMPSSIAMIGFILVVIGATGSVYFESRKTTKNKEIK